MKAFFDAFVHQSVELTPRIFGAALIFFAFWVGGRILRRLLRNASRRTRLEPAVANLLARAAMGTALVFGAVTSLGTLGVNIGALVASLGLTGFALGLALKDALSNVLSGAMILIYHPFRVGQRIALSGVPGAPEGIVTDIDLRYTTLDIDTRRILVPNSSVLTNAVVIHDHHPAAAARGPQLVGH